ncbi:DNA alkylation repair protein [Litoribacter alkaliphilus]|uniref:DNA alkylation repair protein n=1 Tax=Litoribacter ruber TaxID=702568 RepID=A0AAP2CJF6_9BACT|nr:DNA alkylation repair protein [Litoribacter alkaliphilus]MBS9524844.1 DNA alkylation repair protein [Litoribacter alkaliphilus]
MKNPSQQITLIQEELLQHADPEKAEFLPKYFKAVPGGYGEGDRFIGVKVPFQRKVAQKHYRDLSLDELEALLTQEVHEYRLTALFMLVLKFEKAKSAKDRKTLLDFYLNHLDFVNNWDLVDSSAPKILGAYLYDQDKSLLYDFAQSGQLWKQRTAIISTQYFIKKGHFDDTLQLADLLLDHPHDLIHKAVGWMLREVGEKDFDTAYTFLEKRYKQMPRTMLRYTIEKFEPEIRMGFLKGLI